MIRHICFKRNIAQVITLVAEWIDTFGIHHWRIFRCISDLFFYYYFNVHKFAVFWRIGFWICWITSLFPELCINMWIFVEIVSICSNTDNVYRTSIGQTLHQCAPLTQLIYAFNRNLIILLLCPFSKISHPPSLRATMSFIFWVFLMFYQIFLSAQVKRCAIITYKHGINELPHKLPNELDLGSLKIRKYQETV